MRTTREYDLVAVGGGTAGLVSAVGGAYLGARTAIVEKTALGGDCLWTGCVPSKALIASARRAHGMRHAHDLGLVASSPAHSIGDVLRHMRAARETVALHDDPERIRARGVDVHFGPARFVAPDRIEVEGTGTLRSKRFVVATGASPWLPPLPGLDPVRHLTYEDVYELADVPASLVVLGGGPVGLELAQVLSRLGSLVTILEREERVLPGEDPDASALVTEALEDEGIRVRTGVHPSSIESTDCGVRVLAGDGHGFEGAAVLIATGRRPSTSGLELEQAGVTLDGSAVMVDRRLRTTSPTVWAAGDVTGGLQYTHAAEAMAKAALQNSLLPVRVTVDYTTIPRVTFTDPEVAHVGLDHAEAEQRGGSRFEYEFRDLDRAIVDGDTRGVVKITADRKGRILAATIVGSHAAELLLPLVMARRHGLTLAQIATTPFPYPTRVEGIKRAADLFQRSRLEGLGGRTLKRIVSWLT